MSLYTDITRIAVQSISNKSAGISKQVNVYWLSKNIEKLTAHTIVSWPNPKQWQRFCSYFLFDHDKTITYMYSYSHHKKMGKLNTHSPIYCLHER